MIILLLHLTTCNSVEYEATLGTRQILDQNFDLVGNRMSQGRIVSSEAVTDKSKGRSEKAKIIYCLLATLSTRTYERAGWPNENSSTSNGCPVRNLSEALEKANAPLEAEIAPSEHNYGEKIAHKAEEAPAVPVDMADWEQWDGLLDDFLEPDMIE